MEDPLSIFHQWWQDALVSSPLNQKSAVCISTIGSDGFPDGRFVDLKEVNQSGVVFCTSYDSKKGIDIGNDSHVAMTIWWDHVGYQIRLKGVAEKISDDSANKYWATRSRDAQLATTVLQQSQPVPTNQSVKQIIAIANETATEKLPRPQSWGGYLIRPVSIEFLAFKEDRLHQRTFFSNNNGAWHQQSLQP